MRITDKEFADIEQEIAQLREQLAAEQEVGHNTAIALAQQITKLEDQLAAEREKVKLLEEELNEAVKLLKLEDIDGAISKLETKLK